MAQYVIANRALVQGFFRALSDKDEAALGSLVHADVIWTMMLSDAATRLQAVGLEQAVAFFLKGGEGVFAPGDPKSRITAILVEGERAMAETVGTGRRRDGKLYDSVYAWAFEFRDGRIAHVREYTDTAYALRFFDLSAE